MEDDDRGIRLVSSVAATTGRYVLSLRPVTAILSRRRYSFSLLVLSDLDIGFLALSFLLHSRSFPIDFDTLGK